MSAVFDPAALGLRAAATASATAPRETLTQNDFLTLLVTQLKNQDPLNPLDNETFVAQLAQFSTVSGITSTNDKLDALSRLTASNVRTGALQWIGRSVTGPAGESGTVASVAIAEDNSLSLTLETGATLSAADVRHMS
ncbi:flagellar hook assembly protein FlgD [Sandaracinobacter sp.]|uniref:flagellar hook assembly protein FlgD n=1 Tax=Sandaracinobacter sp. TaxID=2487581 RepID=UPI0035B27BC1